MVDDSSQRDASPLGPRLRATLSRVGFAFAALLCGAASLIGCSDSETPKSRVVTAQRIDAAAAAWLQDERLYALLSASCEGRGHYSRDTSDMIPVLVQRLADGQRDVLRYAKSELAAEGEAAIEPLATAMAKWEQDQYAVAPICNGLGALRLSDAEGAHDLLVRYVTHSAVDVRVNAAKGLERHSRPEDYELLVDLFGSVDSSFSSARDVLYAAAAHADPGRMQRDLADMLREGRMPGIWSHAFNLALQYVDDRTAGRFLGIDPAPLGPALRPKLIALQASGGDPERLETLRRALIDGELPERSAALLTLSAIGHPELAAQVLSSRTIPDERSRAAAVLGPIADQQIARDALRVALNDSDSSVRIAALTALLSVGDPLAADRALALLDGSLAEIEMASLSLRDAWDRNPGLAERARDRLLAQIDLDRANFDQVKPRLQALGLIPGRASAVALMALEAEYAGRTVQGLDLHRWLARSAGNAGPEARTYLAERWLEELSEARRMDLLEAAGGAQDKVSREILIDLLEGERATEIERVYAAHLLVTLGPAREVAPLLKRVALRLQGELTRPALDCLLWTWYG